jgi:hypothetical protein
MTYVLSTNVLHQLGNAIWRSWGDQQMDMVGHEHICVNRTATTASGTLKYCQVSVPITVIEKALLSVVSTLSDMLWNIRQIKALWSRHELASLSNPYRSCQNEIGPRNGQLLKNSKEIGSDPF